MRAANLRNGRELASNVAVADSLLKRLKGLLGKETLQRGEGLWIKPCMSIHTVAMKFPIDVIFLNRKKRVIAIVKKIRPNRCTRLYPRAASVLELQEGIIEATATEIGDEIEIR
jgi:uncharacterized membrane protein (UPF0127 family)